MRPRQPLTFAGAGLPVLQVLEVDEKGACVMKSVDFSKQVLPSTETTDLRACLDAGVPLRQVNTKILSQSEVVTDLSVPQNDDDNNNKEGDE